MQPALIKTDAVTLRKLKAMAGGKPLSAYVRDLANGIAPVPVNKLEVIEHEIETLFKVVRRIELMIMRLAAIQGCEGEFQNPSDSYSPTYDPPGEWGKDFETVEHDGD